MNVICMGFPGSSCNAGDRGSIPGLGSSPGEGIGYPFQYSWASLVAQMVKNLPAMSRDLSSIPGLGRSPGGGHGNSLQYSCLENPHGQRSLAGCSPWSCKESDTTEQLSRVQYDAYQLNYGLGGKVENKLKYML